MCSEAKAGVPGKKLALLLLFALCAVSLMGARQMFRGVPIGSVLEVDPGTGAVSVDLGGRDGVLKGIRFAILDDAGDQMALVTPSEIYEDRFWSRPLPHQDAVKLRPGMKVLWLFTPELSKVIQARKKNTPEAYREFVDSFPKSGFIPQLVRIWPEEMLRDIDPEFYKAWKIYTPAAFEAYLKESGGKGLSAAAQAELGMLSELEAEKERERKERVERAAAFEKEQKRQEEIRGRVQEQQRIRETEVMHGKLVNNSSEPVRFEFDPPNLLVPTVVQPGTEFEVNQTAGTYTYKVFGLAAEPEQDFMGGGMDMDTGDGTDMGMGDGTDMGFGFEETPKGPVPLAEGTVDVMFDFWSVEYP